MGLEPLARHVSGHGASRIPPARSAGLLLSRVRDRLTCSPRPAGICSRRHAARPDPTSSGYATLTARNGREGLEKLHESRPNIVLLDLHMPVMDGWEFRRRQLENPQDATIPVVIITAHFNAHEVREVLGLPCLGKPVAFDEVLDAVRHACGTGDV